MATIHQYKDRRDAGRALATQLSDYANRADVLVLGLPRGGIPVAAEVAEALDAPLDAFIVRKLGTPGQEELAMGAIATGDVMVLNRMVVDALGISQQAIDAVAASERRELTRRERLYRGTSEAPSMHGRTVILIDDGLATGSTMRAAIEALKRLGPDRVVMAVPVAAPKTCDELGELCDEAVCALTPEPFYSVGLWYEDFAQTTDEEVRALLSEAEERTSKGGAKPPEGSPRATSPEPPAPGVRPRRGRVAVRSLSSSVREVAKPLTGTPRDYDRLLDLIGDARFVFLGEATHGTEEFYRMRATITQRLIEEKGFCGVAAEADWPDAFRVNRYVRGRSEDSSADEALSGFIRFPQWMWRNNVVVELVDWLRAHNEARSDDQPTAGFYGLDLYSLHSSIDAVVHYLDEVDPEAAARARARYACFEQFGDDPQVYGYATHLGRAEPCEEAVVGQLMEMQRRSSGAALRDGKVARDEFFSAQINALVAKNAEEYYRSMFRGRVSTWNLRDRHMADTLDALADHLDQKNGGRSKVVVWAHNSHIGDARATAMGARNEWNIGQLGRERHGEDAALIGFSTHHGTVTAANDWGAPAERKRVRPGLAGSYEDLFHNVGVERFWLDLREASAAVEALRTPRLQRAIGVIYRPETERFSHYFDVRLPDQFDALLHVDETTALEPLERMGTWDMGELPETYPFGR